MSRPAPCRRRLAHIVLRATATRPAERYAEVADLLEAVEAFQRIPPPRIHESRSRARSIDENLRGESQVCPRPWPVPRQHQHVILERPCGPGRLAADEVLDVFDRVPQRSHGHAGPRQPGGLQAPLASYAGSLERCGRPPSLRLRGSGRRPDAGRLPGVSQFRGQGACPPVPLLIAAVVAESVRGDGRLQVAPLPDQGCRESPCPSPRCCATVATTSRRSLPASAPSGCTRSLARVIDDLDLDRDGVVLTGQPAAVRTLAAVSWFPSRRCCR